MILESLHLLGATGQVRTEQYEGRDHLVVPCVALIGNQIIHAVNSAHPELVPTETLIKAANSWNGRPVVLGHPTRDGRQISANEPGVLASHGIGTIFNSRMSGQKLLMDCFIDPIKAKKLGGAKFLEQMRNGEMCEISVGAFVNIDSKAGNINGRPYSASWIETTGDHVAALPGGTGACSVASGCGMHRTAMRVCEGDVLEVLGPQSTARSNAATRHTASTRGAQMRGSLRQRFEGLMRSFIKTLDEAYQPTPYHAGSDETVTCPTCGLMNDSDASYCDQCGAELRSADGVVVNGQAAGDDYQPTAYRADDDETVTCPKCGLMNDDDARYCDQCGFRLAGAAGVTVTADDDDDPDEKAEDISYSAMADLIEQATTALAAGKTHIDALIAENGPGDDEGVEDAHLEALVAMCVQLYSTTNGVIKMATSCLAPDGTTSPMAYSMEQRAAAGARHNSSDQKIIQDTHDKMVQLGADCPSMKAAASACGCGGSMNRQQAIQTILAAGKKDEFTAPQIKALEECVPEPTLVHLATLAAKSPADALIQAHHNTSTAIAAHGHAMNVADEADAAKKKAAADAVAKKKEDAADGGVDDAEEGADGKKMKAAQAAGFSTIAEHEQDQFYQKNPEIRALVEKQRAQETARKAKLVSALKGGPLSDKELEKKPLEDLETLAAYANVEVEQPVDYSGRGVAVQRSAAESGVFANPPNGYDIAIAKRKAAVN